MDDGNQHNKNRSACPKKITITIIALTFLDGIIVFIIIAIIIIIIIVTVIIGSIIIIRSQLGSRTLGLDPRRPMCFDLRTVFPRMHSARRGDRTWHVNSVGASSTEATGECRGERARGTSEERAPRKRLDAPDFGIMEAFSAAEELRMRFALAQASYKRARLQRAVGTRLLTAEEELQCQPPGCVAP